MSSCFLPFLQYFWRKFTGEQQWGKSGRVSLRLCRQALLLIFFDTEKIHVHGWDCLQKCTCMLLHCLPADCIYPHASTVSGALSIPKYEICSTPTPNGPYYRKKASHFLMWEFISIWKSPSRLYTYSCPSLEVTSQCISDEVSLVVLTADWEGL